MSKHVTRSVTNMGDPLFSLESQVTEEETVNNNSMKTPLKTTFYIKDSEEKNKKKRKRRDSRSSSGSSGSDSSDGSEASGSNKYFKVKFKVSR